MDEELAEFDNRLAHATAAISHEFFQLPVADADALYRERVYCYELYHQLRVQWPFRDLSLSGEVDKVGNPRFAKGPYSRSKPDLLVHSPGDMARNLVVVEVKPTGRPPSDYIRDIMKLSWFVRRAAYHRGVMLIYGAGVVPPLPIDNRRIVWSKLSLLRHSEVQAPAQSIEWQSVVTAADWR